MQTVVLGRKAALDAEGDFAQVYAAHHAEAVRLAYLLSGDRDRAEDIVADAFVKVWGPWRRGAVRDVRAYLRRAVVNGVSSRFRRQYVERREQERRSGDLRGGRGTEEQVADSDLILRAMRRLPERQRTAVVLRYYADLLEADIADAMGISVGTVKSSLSRGLAKLRDVLGEEAQR